jgi:hypothetical protein
LDKKKALHAVVNAIFTYNFVKLHGPDKITNQVKEALKNILKLGKKDQILCDFYGLTGSGL